MVSSVERTSYRTNSTGGAHEPRWLNEGRDSPVQLHLVVTVTVTGASRPRCHNSALHLAVIYKGVQNGLYVLF